MRFLHYEIVNGCRTSSLKKIRELKTNFFFLFDALTNDGRVYKVLVTK